jgi:hypothetical protein
MHINILSTKFTKLDVWEDDSRRRRRFIQNPHGQKHSITATNPLSSKQEQNIEMEKMLKDLGHKMVYILTNFNYNNYIYNMTRIPWLAMSSQTCKNL